MTNTRKLCAILIVPKLYFSAYMLIHAHVIIIATGSDVADKPSRDQHINYNLILVLSIIENKPFGNVTTDQRYLKVIDVQLELT